MSRILPAAVSVEKDLLWSRPFNNAIFHFGGAVGNIYVASQDQTIGGNAYKGCAKNWGEFQTLVKAMDGVFQLNTMRVQLINHPIFSGGTKRFTDLWPGIGVEGVEADLYQNFLQGGTSSTILSDLIHSFVMRPAEYSPDWCVLDLVSVSEKYLNREISWVINQTDFSQADVDDIGKRANVIVGTVKGVPAHAIVAAPSSALRAAMTTASTTVPVYDDFYDILPGAGTVQSGNEKIDYTSKSGAAGSRVLGGLTRTSPEAHALNDTIFQILAEYVYLASGYEMKSIDVVYVEREGKRIPLAASQYTVELANITRKAGQTVAIIKFTSPPVIALKDLVAITDGGVTDSIAVNDPVTVTENIGISQTNNESDWGQNASDETLNFSAVTILANSYQDVTISFPAQEKTKSSGSFKKQVTVTLGAAGWTGGIQTELIGNTTLVLFKNGVAQLSGAATLVEATYWSLTLRRRNISGVNMNVVAATATVTGKNCSYKISVAASKTGTVSKNNTVNKSGTVSHSVSLSSTSTAEKVIGDRVLFDGTGIPDDGAGTYTGTPAALIEKPADVMHYLARAGAGLGGIPLSRIDVSSFQTARAAAPASYKFAGNLVERSSQLRELLLALGMQSRTRPEWPIDKLTARFLKSTYAAPSKTITRNEIQKESLKLSRGSTDDLINVVNLYYGRQWDLGRAKENFQKLSSVSDATSISKYGTREQAERFLFDFIAADNSTMADDLSAFWRDYLKEPPRYADFNCYLDQYEALPGDVRGINYLVGTSEQFDGLNGGQKFLVEEVAQVLGALARGEKRLMRLRLREVS